MENAGTSEEDEGIDSQDSNTPIDHGHLARNCSIKIITPAVKASVISSNSIKFIKIKLNPWRYSSEEQRPTEAVAARRKFRRPGG